MAASFGPNCSLLSGYLFRDNIWPSVWNIQGGNLDVVRDLDSDPDVFFRNTAVVNHHFHRGEGHGFRRIDDGNALLVPTAAGEFCAFATNEWEVAALKTPNYYQ